MRTMSNAKSKSDIQAELDKAQIILAYVLQETGDVVIPKNKPLSDGVAIVVDEDDENLTVRLVTE